MEDFIEEAMLEAGLKDEHFQGSELHGEGIPPCDVKVYERFN